MSPYRKLLQEHISSQSAKCGERDIPSLLELIYSAYTEENPVDNQTIRSMFRKLEPFFSHLTADENDQVFGLICDLCIAHEKTAFLMGLRVGFMLNTELQE